ncbi:hypothetical protein VTI28DRAFT_10027 [Corynascus sepedonium]
MNFVLGLIRVPRLDQRGPHPAAFHMQTPHAVIILSALVAAGQGRQKTPGCGDACLNTPEFATQALAMDPEDAVRRRSTKTYPSGSHIVKGGELRDWTNEDSDAAPLSALAPSWRVVICAVGGWPARSG